MEKLTQKALMVVLTLFILVGMFFGLSTPVKASGSGTLNGGTQVSGPQPTDCPAILCGEISAKTQVRQR